MAFLSSISTFCQAASRSALAADAGVGAAADCVAAVGRGAVCAADAGWGSAVGAGCGDGAGCGPDAGCTGWLGAVACGWAAGFGWTADLGWIAGCGAGAVGDACREGVSFSARGAPEAGKVWGIAGETGAAEEVDEAGAGTPEARACSRASTRAAKAESVASSWGAPCG